MELDAKIFVAGHRGMVGGAILRRLKAAGCTNLLGRSHRQVDLRDQGAVARFFRREQPAYVFLAAARVGGIRANSTYPAQFIYDNLMIESNIIHQAGPGRRPSLRRPHRLKIVPSRNSRGGSRTAPTVSWPSAVSFSQKNY